MTQCIICGSYAINHKLHGRDGSDEDLCDVCYWRKRACIASPVSSLHSNDKVIQNSVNKRASDIIKYTRQMINEFDDPSWVAEKSDYKRRLVTDACGELNTYDAKAFLVNYILVCHKILNIDV
jgi:hypothetical protein